MLEKKLTLWDRELDCSRRNLLKGISSACVLALSSRVFATQSTPSIGIVGGGIVGASIAFHLAEAGARVTLFEKNSPASGATSKSQALISAMPALTDPEYLDLRLRSLLAYQRIDDLLDLGINWGGSILWQKEKNGSDAQAYKKLVRMHEDTYYGPKIIDANDFLRLTSSAIGDFGIGAYAGLDGHLDPVRATRKFLDWANIFGAEVAYPCTVSGLEFKGGKFTGVATSKGYYPLDRVIIAGGVDTPLLSSQAGYVPPLIHAPGLLAHSVPTKAVVNPVKIILGGGVAFKQYADGRLVVGSRNPPDTEVHNAIREGYPQMPESIRTMHGRRILDEMAQIYPEVKGVTLDRLTLGFRPMPKDHMPIVGFIPNSPDIYLAVMHSGVTLAPIMGQYITQEILNDKLVDRLSPYRPERFLG